MRDIGFILTDDFVWPPDVIVKRSNMYEVIGIKIKFDKIIKYVYIIYIIYTDGPDHHTLV